MADPNLVDLADLVTPGTSEPHPDNPYVDLLAASAPAFLAKFSDAVRDVVGELGRANRRIIQLEQRLEVTGKNLAAAMQAINELDELHGGQEYGPYTDLAPTKVKCVGCGKKWPCKSHRILEGLLDGPVG